MEAITDPSTPAFLREVEASTAPPPPVQVPGKGSLALVETAWWLLSSGWLFGSEWMRSRYKVKPSIIGDDDKRKKAESDDALCDKFDGVEPFGGTAGMRQEEDKPTRAAGSGQCRLGPEEFGTIIGLNCRDLLTTNILTKTTRTTTRLTTAHLFTTFLTKSPLTADHDLPNHNSSSHKSPDHNSPVKSVHNSPTEQVFVDHDN
ncbi:hypothetical protein F2Q68_00040843 [Brassica cretica]|uniref:Uncharacterized protein n=1 Tax=Brassica cretica TaxID=69181 RepID=A0A8S9MK00_BRACR|nr:hypothetical protein F2Q68_00040843 [Brassica cretica]